MTLRPAAVLAVSLAAMLISACLDTDAPDSDEPMWAGPVLRIPVGAYDPDHQGAWYASSQIPIRTPADIQWINDDHAYHRVLGFWAPALPPAWLEDQGVGDHDHGDHDHGDDGHDHGDDGHDHQAMGILAFDLELDGGETFEMHLTGEGTLFLHCHPHPWMEAEWEVVPDAPRDYAVKVNRLVVVGQAAGTTAEGDADTVAWEFDAPDLLAVRATLTWDDGKDDVLGQEALNQPDTLRLAIKDPSGNVVAEDSLTARQGDLRVQYAPPGPGWPETLRAASAAAARTALADMGGKDPTLAGTWSFEVTLESAPGAAEGIPPEAPVGDGHQEWNLTVEAVHGWADVDAGPPVEHRVARGPR